jgi:hypothetical protein
MQYIYIYIDSYARGFKIIDNLFQHITITLALSQRSMRLLAGGHSWNLGCMGGSFFSWGIPMFNGCFKFLSKMVIIIPLYTITAIIFHHIPISKSEVSLVYIYIISPYRIHLLNHDYTTYTPRPHIVAFRKPDRAKRQVRVHTNPDGVHDLGPGI